MVLTTIVYATCWFPFQRDAYEAEWVSLFEAWQGFPQLRIAWFNLVGSAFLGGATIWLLKEGKPRGNRRNVTLFTTPENVNLKGGVPARAPPAPPTSESHTAHARWLGLMASANHPLEEEPGV